jgi:hypothetical protein
MRGGLLANTDTTPEIEACAGKRMKQTRKVTVSANGTSRTSQMRRAMSDIGEDRTSLERLGMSLNDPQRAFGKTSRPGLKASRTRLEFHGASLGPIASAVHAKLLRRQLYIATLVMA